MDFHFLINLTRPFSTIGCWVVFFIFILFSKDNPIRNNGDLDQTPHMIWVRIVLHMLQKWDARLIRFTVYIYRGIVPLSLNTVGHIVRKLDFAQANNKRAVDAGLLSLLSFTEYIHVVKHIRILYPKSLCLFLSQFKTNLAGNREERFCRDEVYVLTTSSQLQHQQIVIPNIYELKIYMRHVMRKPVVFFAYAETKTQISCAVTAQRISAFVFAT